MPGKQVKNWPQYEALRREGYSKQSAARITNSQAKRSKAAKQGHKTRRAKKG
jgi:hypothetical protein